METAHELFEHELQSAYDGVKRLERGLGTVVKAASHPDLSTKVQDLHTAVKDQVQRVEEIFELLHQDAQKQESKPAKAFLDEFRTFTKVQKPEKEILDVFVAHVAGDIAQYAMEEFQGMLQIAEQAGATNASPKIADNLQVSMKEHKKIHKDIQKLTDTLIQQIRPS
jgi:ferritin-like metal-binding protein YciE